MTELEEFLQRDKDAMEMRQYRHKAQEQNFVNKIIEELEREEQQKRERFKRELIKLGVKVKEREAENELLGKE